MNIKTVATTATTVVAAGVAVGTVVKGIRLHRANRVQHIDTPVTVVKTNGNSMADAFTAAQNEISDRVLLGFYDDKSDEVVKNDFTILFNTHLNK